MVVDFQVVVAAAAADMVFETKSPAFDLPGRYFLDNSLDGFLFGSVEHQQANLFARREPKIIGVPQPPLRPRLSKRTGLVYWMAKS